MAYYPTAATSSDIAFNELMLMTPLVFQVVLANLFWWMVFASFGGRTPYQIKSRQEIIAGRECVILELRHDK